MAADDVPVVVVPDYVRDLVPLFFDEARELAGAVRLAGDDRAAVHRAGHTLKGLGRTYGFEHVGALGEAIESGAESTEIAVLQQMADEVTAYLDCVRVE
jgi:HPt (histidine-containing phosphotransfer) domain-containing protein